MDEHDTSRISPTAHYTGYVWCKNGLSPDALATSTGRLMFAAMRAPMRIASLSTGGMTLEKMLLQRHLIIDHLLEQAIEAGHIGQVVEVAAGLSGRGRRLTERHPSLVYVEGDLPAMAARKRNMLAALPSASSHHHVVALNALLDDGELAIGNATGEHLQSGVGTAVVTEGLLNYFPRHHVLGMWERFARFLRQFPRGMYTSDIHLDDAAHRTATLRAFRTLLTVVARGSVQLSFQDRPALDYALRESGFADTLLHLPRALTDRLPLPRTRGEDFVNVLEAWC